MISGERKRENVNNTEKNTHVWPSERVHFPTAPPLARLGASRTSLRAPTAQPGPLTRVTTRSARAKGPCPHPVLSPLPIPVTLPAPWTPATPITHCGPAGEGGRPGPGALHTQLLRGKPPSRDDPEATVCGSWGAQGALSLGLHSCRLPSLPVGKKWVWPPTLPHASTLLTYGRTPQPQTRHHKGPTHIRGAEMNKTHM